MNKTIGATYPIFSLFIGKVQNMGHRSQRKKRSPNEQFNTQNTTFIKKMNKTIDQPINDDS